VTCSYGALVDGRRQRCNEPAWYFVYLTDPITGIWPGARCRQHALTELLGAGTGNRRASNAEARYRAVAVDPIVHVYTPPREGRITF